MAGSDNDDPLLGCELSGKYRIQSLLGAGGFGSVYSAINLVLGTEVAIKVTRPGRDDARALDEARAAARLRSPHTVRIFDVGYREDGTLYIVMEHLEGRSLREYLADEGTLPVSLAARLIGEACLALQESHSLGIVHRDVKPSNLFVVEGRNVRPHLKLLDFGLARQVEGTTLSSQSEHGKVVGSPPYMSPEQVRGTRLSAHSDLWSLGVVLYEALSGRLPFEGQSPSGTLVAIAADPPTPLDELRPDLPEEMLGIVACCLRKAKEERFASAAELGRALAPFVSDQEDGASSPQAARRASPRASSPPTVRSLTVALPALSRRRARIVPALAAAVLTLGLLAKLVPIRSGAPPSTPADAPATTVGLDSLPVTVEPASVLATLSSATSSPEGAAPSSAPLALPDPRRRPHAAFPSNGRKALVPPSSERAVAPTPPPAPVLPLAVEPDF